MKLIIMTLTLFFTASFFEIGGGYLIWKWLKEGTKIYFGIVGGISLFIYGVIPTLQPSHFGRVYAAYGGIFIVSSLVWGAIVDKKRPDKYEVIGSIITLIGIIIIFYSPRE